MYPRIRSLLRGHLLLVAYLLFFLFGSSYALAASPTVPPPPTKIHTSAGAPIRLYDATAGYQSKPFARGLLDRGFNRAVNWTGANPPQISWLNTPPNYVLQNGSTEESDVRANIDAVCEQVVSHQHPTLVVVDIEWPWVAQSGGAPPYTYSPIAQNISNLTTILSWVRSEFSLGPCASVVRLGVYDATPVNWDLFEVTNPDPASAQSWRSFVQTMTGQLAPYVDFFAPSLYAHWAPDSDASLAALGLNHVTAWQNAVGEELSELKAASTNFGVPVIPFLGLRYYSNVTGSSPYQYKYVESSFFSSMLGAVSTPAYATEGAVYWDWGGFGGSGYANDGSNVWTNSAGWYATTFSFFNAPARTFSLALPAIYHSVTHP